MPEPFATNSMCHHIEDLATSKWFVINNVIDARRNQLNQGSDDSAGCTWSQMRN